MPNISEFFWRLKSEYGITQRQFSEAIGIALSTVGVWKRNNAIKPKHFQAIATKFPEAFAKYKELIQ